MPLPLFSHADAALIEATLTLDALSAELMPPLRLPPAYAIADAYLRR